MKKIIAITAAILTFGFLGAGVASAHFGPHYYDNHRIVRVMPGYGRGLMHRAAYRMQHGYGPGPAFCLTTGGPHWRGDGHGPRHRGGRR